jgi:tRNA (guanine26-N2/guanine27-N2)-dimethyltransferase
MGGKKSNVYQSIRLTPPQCPETGSPWKVGGPLWLGPLHDQDVVREAIGRLSDPNCTSPNMKLIATRKRLLGLLTSVSEELDVPLFYSLPDICKKLHCSSPPLKLFKAAIVNAGYKVSGYHKDPSAIKTDAPHDVIWDIMRSWIKHKSPLNKPPPEDSAAAKILAVEPRTKVDFISTPRKDAATSGGSACNGEKISRFPQNPQTHWGPKRKASGKYPSPDDA